MSKMKEHMSKEQIIKFLRTQSPQELAAIKELLVCSADENDDYNDLVNKLLNPPTREIRIKEDGANPYKIEFLSIHNQGSEEIVQDTWYIAQFHMLKEGWQDNWLKRATLPDGRVMEEAI